MSEIVFDSPDANYTLDYEQSSAFIDMWDMYTTQNPNTMLPKINLKSHISEIYTDRNDWREVKNFFMDILRNQKIYKRKNISDGEYSYVYAYDPINIPPLCEYLDLSDLELLDSILRIMKGVKTCRIRITV